MYVPDCLGRTPADLAELPCKVTVFQNSLVIGIGMDHSVLNADCQCFSLTKLLIDHVRCVCGSSIAFQKLLIINLLLLLEATIIRLC